MDPNLRAALIIEVTKIRLEPTPSSSNPRGQFYDPNEVVSDVYGIVDAFEREDNRRQLIAGAKVCDEAVANLKQRLEKRELKSVLGFVQAMLGAMQSYPIESLKMSMTMLNMWAQGKQPVDITPDDVNKLIFIFENSKRGIEQELAAVST